MGLITVACLLSLIFSIITGTNAEGCIARDYGAGSVVCVCTEDNCDFFEQYYEESISGGSYLIYTTSKDGQRFASNTGTFSSTEKEPTITIDKSTTYQQIIGFGGALTDSAGYNMMNMSASLYSKVISTLFGLNGAQYSLVRIPMASSDFSRSYYTYDDVDGKDVNLEHFALQYEDINIKFPIIRDIRDIRGPDPIRFFTAPWFAPAWMRADPSSEYYTLSREYYGVWANYFIKYLDAYAEQGFRFWALAPQNEPYQMYFVRWDVENYTDWTANYLIPALQNSMHKDITLMLFDDNRDNLPGWVERSLQDETIKNFVKGTAVHWYADGSVPADVLSQTHDLDPDKFILYTESCELRKITPDHLGDWDIAESYGTHMLEAFNNWVIGWVEWNMVLDVDGGGSEGGNRFNAPIIFNITANEFYKQPPFYIQAHFSRFVPPESKRIGADSDESSGLQSVAFITTEDVIVVILMNKQDDEVSAIIRDPDYGDISIQVAPRSFNTLLYK